MSIHQTVTIHDGARIAEDVSIGAYSVIGPGVTIGPGTRLFERVTIAGRTALGSECKVYTGAVVGSDPQDLKYSGEDTAVELGDRTVVREYVTINKGTSGGGGVTRVGAGCMLMAYSHVAHDCEVRDHVLMANSSALGGHVLVEEGASVSALVGVHHFGTIGRKAFVSGMAKVTRDVPPYMIVAGNPARVRGVNIIGMRRADIPRANISAMRQCCRLLYHSALPMDAAKDKILTEGLDEIPEVKYLLDFLARVEKGNLGRAREASRA